MPPQVAVLRKYIKGIINESKTLSEVRFIGSFAEKNSSEYQVSTPHGHPEYFGIFPSNVGSFAFAELIPNSVKDKIIDKTSQNIKNSHLSFGSNATAVVNTNNKTVDLDDAKSEYRSRRSGTSRSKAYTIPHGDVAFDEVNNFKKILIDLMKIDSRVTSDFDIIGNPKYEHMTIGDIISGDKLRDISDIVKGGEFKPMTFYHGTSLTRAKLIMRQGLVPGKTQEIYSDLVDNYSKHNIYLTDSVSVAENYATRAAIEDKSTAAVLKVVVKDPTKFMLDEDSAGWLNDGSYEENIHFSHKAWRNSPDAKQIMAKYQATIIKAARHSKQIAYRGKILAHDINIHSKYKPASMPKSPNAEQFRKAREKTMKTYKMGK